MAKRVFYFIISIFILDTLGAKTLELNYTNNVSDIRSALMDDRVIESIRKNQVSHLEANEKYDKHAKITTNTKKIDFQSKEDLLTNFSLLKSLTGFKMSKYFTQKEMIKTLNINILNQYEKFKIPLIFAYSLEFDNESKAQEILQKKISDYILQNYAISILTVYDYKENGKYNQYIDESTYGLVMATAHNKKFQRSYLDNGRIAYNGVVQVDFYPFYKNEEKHFSKNIQQNPSNKNTTVKLFDITKNEIQSNYFPQKQYGQIAQFKDKYKSIQKTLNRFQSLQFEIKEKQKYYQKLRLNLFSLDDRCNSFHCVHKSINKYNQKEQLLSGKKTYAFKYDMATNSSFGAAFSMIIYDFTKDLEQSAKSIAIRKSGSLGDGGFSTTNSTKQIEPLYKNVEILYYIQNKQPKIVFIADVSYESNNKCKALVKDIEFDPYLKTNFLSIEYNGKSIKIMDSEVTKKMFSTFLEANPHIKDKITFNKKCKRYYEKLADNMPISCVSTTSILKYIKWLNKEVYTEERLRLPECDEWQYIASCGNTNKYCWGNNKNSKKTNENFNYKNPLKVKSFGPNGVGVYDMCGNVHEYCFGKFANRKRIKAIGGSYNQKNPINKIFNGKGEAYGFRLIKE